MYGGIALTLRERSAHVEGHEIGVSGETISLLTPCARGWPSLHHRSAMRTQPHRLLWDYNQSNYYSLLATEVESEREVKMHFFTSATIVQGEARKVRTLKWHNPKYRYQVMTGFRWLLTRFNQNTQLSITDQRQQFYQNIWKWLYNVQWNKNPFSHPSSHLCEVFAGLALILMATGMEVACNGWDSQVELAILDKDVF